MSIASEFKEFIMRGNVVDLAVGMVVGTAFSGIVNRRSTTSSCPLSGILIGGVDFFQPVYHSERRHARTRSRLRFPSGCQSRRCCYAECRPVHQHHHQLPDYRRRHFRGSQTVELAEEKRSSGGRSTCRTERRSFAAARNPRLPEQKITV